MGGSDFQRVDQKSNNSAGHHLNLADKKCWEHPEILPQGRISALGSGQKADISSHKVHTIKFSDIYVP